MADMLATAAEFALLPDQPDVPEATVEFVIGLATGIVQAAARQRLVAVTDEPFELIGTTESWLDLPQRPVTAVSAVEINGEALTVDEDYVQHGDRLWRSCGWATYACEPAKVTGVYSHGYAADDWRLQRAKAAVLMLTATGVKAAGGGITSESIDDYQVVYDRMAAQMEASPTLARSLRNTYGRRVGLVRLG